MKNKIAIINVMKTKDGADSQGMKTFQNQMIESFADDSETKFKIFDVLYGTYKRIIRPHYFLHLETDTILEELKAYDTVIFTGGILGRFKEENRLYFNLIRDIRNLSEKKLIHLECGYIKGMLNNRTHTMEQNIQEYCDMMDSFVIHNNDGDYHEMIKPHITDSKLVFSDHLLLIQQDNERFSELRKVEKQTDLTTYTGRPSDYKGMPRYREVFNKFLKGKFYAAIDGTKLGMGYLRLYVDFIKQADGSQLKSYHDDVDFTYYFGGAKQKTKMWGDNPETDIVLSKDKISFLEQVPHDVHLNRRAKSLFFFNPTIRPNSGGTVEYVLLEAMLMGSIPVIWKERAEDIILKDGRTLYEAREDYGGIIIYDGDGHKMLGEMKAMQDFYDTRKDTETYDYLVAKNIRLIEENWGTGIWKNYLNKILTDTYRTPEYELYTPHRNTFHKKTTVLMPAAGRGTRMRGEYELPKCLLPNKKGVPIMVDTINQLNDMGVQQIFVTVHETTKNVFEEHLKGIENVVIIVDKKQDGLLEAVNELKEFIIRERFPAKLFDDLLIWLPDNAFVGKDWRQALIRLENNFYNNGDWTFAGYIATKVDYPEALISECKDGIFRDKPSEEDLGENANSLTGVFYVSRDLFMEDLLADKKLVANGEASLYDSWLTKASSSKHEFVSSKWFDIGTPERYKDFLAQSPTRIANKKKQHKVIEPKKVVNMFDILGGE